MNQSGANLESISFKIGSTAETPRKWVRRAQIQQRKTREQFHRRHEADKNLEKENEELRQVNEILHKAESLFRPGGARPPTQVMICFIDEHRRGYGVEPICRALHPPSVQGQREKFQSEIS